MRGQKCQTDRERGRRMAYSGYTEAKKECNKRYLAKFSTITLRVTAEERKEIEQKARAEGKSVNQYLKDKALGN